MENKRIGIVIKNEGDAQAKAQELVRTLGDKCCVIHTHNVPPDTPIPDDIGAIVVLGGDGTFLSVARFIGTRDIPLMGVKFGEVGFLAETTEDHLYQAIDALCKGDYIIRERTRLTVRVIRDDKEIVREDVLNDAVINKSALSRLASCAVYLDGNYLTTYRADGLIVATPTGSTAYSLAAGGPVVHPEVPGIVLSPICPFTLTNRPLIIPDHTPIEIRLAGSPEDIVLTLDGQTGHELDPGDRIFLKKSPSPVKMISFNDQSYFKVLKTRLHWSGGRRNPE
ncbi:MAG: NAD(+)/NADH kinase [Desulfobacterales bacterium]|nr:NAD(+)/NADH kinase [Desulfobacterales bacterium]